MRSENRGLVQPINWIYIKFGFRCPLLAVRRRKREVAALARSRGGVLQLGCGDVSGRAGTCPRRAWSRDHRAANEWLTFNLQKWKRKARARRGAARLTCARPGAAARSGEAGCVTMVIHHPPVSLLRPQPSVRLLVRAPAILDSSADQFAASSFSRARVEHTVHASVLQLTITEKLFLRRLKTGQAQRGPSAAASKCRLPIYPVSVVIHKRVYLVQAAWQFNKLCFSGMQPFECLQFCTRKPPVEAAVVVTYLQFSTQVCFLFFSPWQTLLHRHLWF